MDYGKRFKAIVAQTSWQIELPEEMSNFFEQRGYDSPMNDDERRFARVKLPLRAVLLFEESLPFLSREHGKPFGVFTANVSRCGLGFLFDKQLYPEEKVRVLLPNCWFELKVAHCRRMGNNCFTIGCHLIGKHEPDSRAFDIAAPEISQAPGA